MNTGLNTARQRPQLRCFYWQEDKLIGNLGDALVPILIRSLGYEPVSVRTSSPTVHNPQRCLLVIGSLLTHSDLERLPRPVDVWGCGWKGYPLPQELLAEVTLHAVRGPLTVAGLGLPLDTPLGDPALLLPKLVHTKIVTHNRSVVVPHYHRASLMTAKQRRRRTGCNEVISPMVFQRQGLRSASVIPQFRMLAKRGLVLGIRSYSPWQAVKRIAGADFVLTGSLHGAILAQAYGIPWAAYDDGYIDAPPKWLDWAAYLGIHIDFVSNLMQGQRWWESQGRFGRIQDLEPLLAAFPYPIFNDPKHAASQSSLLNGPK